MLRLPVGYRVPLGMVSVSSPPHERNDLSDIRETLDQLDRRLDDLRRQVAVLVEDPHPASPPPPPPPRRLHSVPPPPPELTDPEPSGVPEGSAEPGSTPLPPEPEAGRDPGKVNTDRGQLMAVRDQLMAGARELVRAYERQLDLLENMAVTGVPPARPVVASGPVSPAPPSAPSEPAPTRSDPPAAPGLFPSLAVVADQNRPAFFEGTVMLVVSGAHRIQTIQVLEDSLSRARHVKQVYVRRCHRGQVWLELSLSAGAELLGEFNRVLPFPFAVTSATRTEIALGLEGEQ